MKKNEIRERERKGGNLENAIELSPRRSAVTILITHRAFYERSSRRWGKNPTKVVHKREDRNDLLCRIGTKLRLDVKAREPDYVGRVDDGLTEKKKEELSKGKGKNLYIKEKN